MRKSRVQCYLTTGRSSVADNSHMRMLFSQNFKRSSSFKNIAKIQTNRPVPSLHQCKHNYNFYKFMGCGGGSSFDGITAGLGHDQNRQRPSVRTLSQDTLS